MSQKVLVASLAKKLPFRGERTGHSENCSGLKLFDNAQILQVPIKGRNKTYIIFYFLGSRGKVWQFRDGATFWVWWQQWPGGKEENSVTMNCRRHRRCHRRCHSAKIGSTWCRSTQHHGGGDDDDGTGALSKNEGTVRPSGGDSSCGNRWQCTQMLSTRYLQHLTQPQFFYPIQRHNICCMIHHKS